MENVGRSYDDWKSWAAMLVQALQGAQQGALNIPSYSISEGSRNGLPPALKGDCIWILENGIRKLGVWDGNSWIKYSPET